MANSLCPYFNECGGCSLQHIDYVTQLDNKRSRLAQVISCEDIKVFSGNEYGYRNRMDFIFHSKGLGFRKKDKWQIIIDVDRCVISNEKINLLLNEVRSFFKHPDYFDLKKQTGSMKYCVIRATKESSSISFVLNEDSSTISEVIDKIKDFINITTADNIIVTYVPKQTDESISAEFYVEKGTDMLKGSLLGKTFLFSVQGFFQNNTEMAEKMHDYVNNLLKQYNTKNAHLLDLYAGVGTFGIINSDLFKTVKVVESVKPCIDAANLNFKENNITNAEAILLDAEKIRRLTFLTPLYVITDPPRSGMHEKTIQHLRELKPEVIVYISCNIEQLGKDIPKFKGYKVKSAALFDLFPQTNHCEAIVELVLEQSTQPNTL